MAEETVSRVRRFGSVLTHQFVTGLLVVIPVVVTVWLVRWVFDIVDDGFQPLVELIFGHHITGVGFGFFVVLMLLFGIIANKYIGRTITYGMEQAISKVPVVSTLYQGIKRIIESFSQKGGEGHFASVVLVEFPRDGMLAVGFLTSEMKGEYGETLLNVYIPTGPNPTGGFLQIVPESAVIRTDIPVDDAIKMVVSVGSTTHSDINKLLSKKTPDSMV